MTRSAFRLSPATAALPFGMSRHQPPRLDNLRRKTTGAKIGMGYTRTPQASRPPPRLATPTTLDRRKRDKDCGSLLDSSTRWRDERAENRAG